MNSAPTFEPESVAALGDLLRQAREGRGLTLPQIANETKIPQRHLEALEHGNLAGVPGGMYRRAEIRAYARAVGLDPQVALIQLDSVLRAPAAREAAAAEIERRRRRSRARRRVMLAILAVAAAAFFALAPWIREKAGRAGGNSPTTAPLPLPPAAAAPRGPAQAPETTRDAPVGTSGQRGVDPAVSQSVDPTGDLVITTEPPGARVTVDGIGWGFTPITVRDLPYGHRRIRVTRDGYVSEQRVVRLSAGGSATVHFDMRVPSAPF